MLRFRILAAFSLLFLLPLESAAFSLWPFGNPELDYEVRIAVADKDLRQWFSKLGLDEKTSEHPPETLADLDGDGAQRGNRLREALAAKGYYDASVSYKIETSAKPAAVLYDIKQGKRYRIAAVKAEWEGDEIRKLDITTFPVKRGQFVDAEAINDYAAKLNIDLNKDSCLLSLSVRPLLELDPRGPAAVLIYQIKHGHRAHFGKVMVEGNSKVSERAILHNVTWKRGDCFDASRLDKAQSALIGTQLFSVVKVTPGADVDAMGEVPVTVSVSERVERTLSAGVNYATDQGFGLKLGWEHRNWLGDAEKIDANAVFAQQEQSLALTERSPGFRRDDQSLVLSGSIKRENTEAYTSQDIESTASVERRISPQLNAGLGAGLLLDRSNDVIMGVQNFGLISFPGFLDYDTRDNAQDARKGVYAHLAVTPYIDTFDLSTDFAKILATGQTYLSSDITGKPTLALRASIGGIEGATSSNLPANLRFYAGGGGSVRGYSYQSLSPRFQGTPIGGGSLVELSAELRVRFSESFGGVVFLDGGNAYSDSVPNFSNPLYLGAGAGLRYYSPLGPLRLDVGFPLNGHDIDGSGEDASGLQIYVSLGQAF